MKHGNVLEPPKLGSVAIEHGSDPAVQLEVCHGLPLRRVGLVNALHAPLKIGERPFLLRMNGGGQDDIRDVVERVVGVPRHDDEELRLAQVSDDRWILRPLTEVGVGDEEDVDAGSAVGHQVVEKPGGDGSRLLRRRGGYL